MTSLDPFAAQIHEGVEAGAEVAGEGLTQRRELPVRVAVHLEQGRPDASDDVLRDVLGHRMGVLVDVEGDGDRVPWGAP